MVKNCNAGDPVSIPGLGRSTAEENGNPLQYSCLENPHGQRSLLGYCPRGRKDLDTTERLTLSLLFIYLLESPSSMEGWVSWLVGGASVCWREEGGRAYGNHYSTTYLVWLPVRWSPIDRLLFSFLPPSAYSHRLPSRRSTNSQEPTPA